jgi:plasmid stabilization system protein ParE
MARILRREAAKRDLTRHFAYLGENASLDVADRFLGAVRESLRELSMMPGIGIPGRVQQGKFSGVRLWPVRDFERYLIIYRPLPDGVIVERVIHAAQDYQRVLR